MPFLKVVNDTAVAVNQGGKRKGAVCAYLETWHLDIEEFLELRKNTGDDRRRTHDMNTANWIPDLFMKRVQRKRRLDAVQSRRTCPTCTTCSAAAFEEALRGYEEKAARGEMKLFKKLPAVAAVAQDAVACCSRPAIRGSRSRIRATSARRSSTWASCTLEPVHRNHAQHQRYRNRRLQPRLGQPARAHVNADGTCARSRQAASAPSAPPCACSTT